MNTFVRQLEKVTMSLIDIGANLTHRTFDYNLNEIIERAGNAQVNDIIITGTSLNHSRKAIDLVSKWNGYDKRVRLYSTIGIHPHEATRTKSFDYRQQLIHLLENNRTNQTVVALGECGLDFDRNYSLHDDQREVFEIQLQLACQYNLPLFLHERSASKDMLDILRKYSSNGNFRGVIHCFTHGSLDILREYLALNLYVGITGWVCDHRRGQDLAKIVSNIPLDRLVIETDAPFLIPATHPRPWPKFNEPSLLPLVVKKLSECYSISPDEIARHTTENAKRLFNLLN